MSDLTSDLMDQVAHAVAHQQPMVIEGNKTKYFLGRHTKETAQTISVAAHTGIISYEPVELVMTARAGTTLADIDATLEEQGQMLACDPARFSGKATIGGSLACNQAGPARPWIGSLRDHILGVSLINGNAEHLQFGGQVMKNVAGYDASRLQAGAMGTLGLMTALSFKVLPKPAAETTLVKSASLSEAIHLMNTLAGQPKPLSGACWLDGHVHLRLSGAKSAVEGTAVLWGGDQLDPQEAQLFWSRLRDQESDFFTRAQIANEPLWRFSVNPTAPTFLPEGLEDESAWLLDWCGAQRWLKGDFSSEPLQEWAREQGGEVVLYRGGDRQQAIFEQPNSVIKRIQKNIKHAFDPNHLFNNGRLHVWM